MIPIDSQSALPLQPTTDDATPAAADPRFRAKAAEAAEKFESYFIANMLHQMRNATRELADEDSIYRNRIDSDMLDLADGKVADTLAGQHAFGIADAILRQVLPPADANTSAALKSGTETVAIPLKNRAESR